MNPNQVPNTGLMVSNQNLAPAIQQMPNIASPHQIANNPPINHPSQQSQTQTAAPQQPQQQYSHQSTNPQMSNHDINRLKVLISNLRETLRNFFIISGMNLDYGTQIDNFNKNLEQPPKLEKSLEDILALCNQIELCLRTILECTIQLHDSKTYLPFQVSKEYSFDQSQMLQDMNHSQTKSYSTYLNIIKKQVTYAKSVYEILSESVKQIKQHPPTTNDQQMSVIPGQQQQQQQSMQTVHLHHNQMQQHPSNAAKLSGQLQTH